MKIDEKKIKEVMAAVWQIDSNDIPSDAKLNDFVHWDSLGHVNLLLELENEFGIKIGYETVNALISLPAILEYLNKKYDRYHIS